MTLLKYVVFWKATASVVFDHWLPIHYSVRLVRPFEVQFDVMLVDFASNC